MLSVVDSAVADVLNDLFKLVDDALDAFGDGSGCFCILDMVLWLTVEFRPGECIDCDDNLFLSRQYIGDVG